MLRLTVGLHIANNVEPSSQGGVTTREFRSDEVESHVSQDDVDLGFGRGTIVSSPARGMKRMLEDQASRRRRISRHDTG